MIYPWLEKSLQGLARDHQALRLPHALMITGLEGTGKLALAASIARMVLCHSPTRDGNPCGTCKGCGAWSEEEHPDRSYITMTEDDRGKLRKLIVIEQIRELIGALGLKSHLGGYKVAIVNPADHMNAAAANALLKTLEEPPGATLLVLVSDRPGRLPATIRSRCRLVPISRPEETVALDWLQSQDISSERGSILLSRAGGAPLKALEYAEQDNDQARRAFFTAIERISTGQLDPAGAVAATPDGAVEAELCWLNEWIQDMIRLDADPETRRLYHPDLRASLVQAGQKFSTRALFRLSDGVTEARRLLDTPVNAKMQLEGHLIRLSALARG